MLILFMYRHYNHWQRYFYKNNKIIIDIDAFIIIDDFGYDFYLKELYNK